MPSIVTKLQLCFTAEAHESANQVESDREKTFELIQDLNEEAGDESEDETNC